MTETALPHSVRRLGRGALFYARRLEVYEGTAKGLIAAVNTVFPASKEKVANIEWTGCRIVVKHLRKGKTEELMIPENFKISAAGHLECAWNGAHIDYEEYDLCLDAITDAEEKLEFAQMGLMRCRNEEENPYSSYVRRVSYKLGHRLLEEKKEEEFLAFLKQGFLSDQSLSRLLKYSNTQGMTVCSAYMMEQQGGKKKKVSSFRL